MGLSEVFGTLSFAAGPVITGRINDVTGRYTCDYGDHPLLEVEIQWPVLLADRGAPSYMRAQSSVSTDAATPSRAAPCDRSFFRFLSGNLKMQDCVAEEAGFELPRPIRVYTRSRASSDSQNGLVLASTCSRNSTTLAWSAGLAKTSFRVPFTVR